jgi:hypothetical protein
MTAVEFELENPDDPESARIVPDTSKVETILPELERVKNQRSMASAGQAAEPGGSSGSGLLGGIKDALGLGGSGEPDREQLAAAEEMAQMYADDLQAKLEEAGKWERVREAARSG